MSVLWFLVPAALALGLFFLVLFLIGASKGQFDDLDTPAQRMLYDESTHRRKES